MTEIQKIGLAVAAYGVVGFSVGFVIGLMFDARH